MNYEDRRRKVNSFASCIVSFVLVISLCLSMSGCSSSRSSNEPLNDDDFLQNIVIGLEKRWKLADTEPDSFSDDTKFRDFRTKCVQCELDALGGLESYLFSDADLAQLASLYYDALNSQLSAVQYLNRDNDKHSELWEEKGYNQRAIILYKLNKSHKLDVSKGYEDALYDFIVTGEAYANTELVTAELSAIISELEFSVTDSSGSWKDYSATIENTTSVDFDSVDIDINLIDKAGIVISQEFDFIDNWNQQSKNAITFGTDTKFTVIEIRICGYDNNFVEYDTGYISALSPTERQYSEDETALYQMIIRAYNDLGNSLKNPSSFSVIGIKVFLEDTVTFKYSATNSFGGKVTGYASYHNDMLVSTSESSYVGDDVEWNDVLTYNESVKK